MNSVHSSDTYSLKAKRREGVKGDSEGDDSDGGNGDDNVSTYNITMIYFPSDF